MSLSNGEIFTVIFTIFATFSLHDMYQYVFHTRVLWQRRLPVCRKFDSKLLPLILIIHVYAIERGDLIIPWGHRIDWCF